MRATHGGLWLLVDTLGTERELFTVALDQFGSLVLSEASGRLREVVCDLLFVVGIGVHDRLGIGILVERGGGRSLGLLGGGSERGLDDWGGTLELAGCGINWALRRWLHKYWRVTLVWSLNHWLNLLKGWTHMPSWVQWYLLNWLVLWHWLLLVVLLRWHLHLLYRQ